MAEQVPPYSAFPFDGANCDAIASRSTPGPGQWGLCFLHRKHQQPARGQQGNLGIGVRNPLAKLHIAAPPTPSDPEGIQSAGAGYRVVGMSATGDNPNVGCVFLTTLPKRSRWLAVRP
jgi:hypothetical protein